MNGSENSFAGALFFALISLGAVLKIDDVILGGGICAGTALLAAISFRHALVKSSQATEEDHQRMEVQFQQLRSKINETISVNVTAMNSLSEVTELFQENLQLLRENLKLFQNKQSELDNLALLVKSAEELNASVNGLVAGLEENSFSLNAELEKISVAIQEQGNISDVTTELNNIAAIEDTNRANLQTILKIVHVIAQMIKTPAYMQELEKINFTIEQLGTRDLKKINSTIEQLGAHDLKKINATIEQLGTRDLEKINSTIEQLGTRNEIFDELKNSTDAVEKNLSELVKINGSLSRGFTTSLDDLRLDVAKLSDKLEELSRSLSKSGAALTEDDISLFKKIAAKINLK